MRRQSCSGQWSGIARAVAAAVLACLFALVPAGVAAAHAELSTSDPADGSVVATSPEVVTLQFSEGVSVQPDGVRILDGDGKRVDTGKAVAADDLVKATVDGVLPNGGYVVAWRVVSDDGHPIRGAFSFSVGSRTALRSGLAGEAFEGSTDRFDDLAGAGLRFLSYLAVLGVAGAVLIGAALRRPDEPSPVGRLAAGVAALGLAALLLQLPVQASLATGGGWGSLTEPGVLDLVLSDGVGWSLAWSALSLVVLLITVDLPFTGAVKALAVAGATIAPLGFVVTGHTRTMSPALVGYAADAAHVSAGAVWFGGLGALLVVMRRRRRGDDATGAAEAVATFSGWAAFVVGVVVVSGSILGWIEVGGLQPLTSTTYGRLLMAKVALVLVVLAGAAWNRFRLIPAMEAVEADPARTWTLLTRVIRFEVVAMVAILGVTGVLTNVTPARTVVGDEIVSVRADLGDGSVEVVVSPARVGRNDIHAYILDKDGGVDGRDKDATLQLALPAKDIGPVDRPPVLAAPGHFQLVGTDLDLAGEWTLTVTVKTDRFTEETATVRFRVR